jgi:hypothetical protein
MNNKLIEKLALQAGHPGFPRGEIELEKFAELIVRECADIMDGWDENGNAKDGQYLLTQFGIDASQRYT